MKTLHKRIEKLQEKIKPSGLYGVLIIDGNDYIFNGKKYTEAEWKKLRDKNGINSVVTIIDSFKK